MSEKAIDIGMLRSDIKRMIYKARSHKKKILNKDHDIYTRIEQAFNERGYVYNLNRGQKKFTILASHAVSIIGFIDKATIKLGPAIRYDDTTCSFLDVNIGMVEFPATAMDMFIPLIDEMICEGRAITDRYEALRKNEKTALLLESLVIEYMKKLGVGSIDVSCNKDGVVRLYKRFDNDFIVRVPVDFDNYETQCEAWFKVWKLVANYSDLTELKDSKVQVLERSRDWVGAFHWTDIATGKTINEI